MRRNAPGGGPEAIALVLAGVITVRVPPVARAVQSDATPVCKRGARAAGVHGATLGGATGGKRLMLARLRGGGFSARAPRCTLHVKAASLS